MNDWQSVYRVELALEEEEGLFDSFRVINIITGEIVGTYIGQHYAKRQARYRYKKELKKIEKLLLK